MSGPPNRSPLDPRLFRSVMGRFATGVCVVTTTHEGHVHGATVNSFTSVSLDPPLILVSLDNRARLLEQVRLSGSYAVSILTDSQESLSNHFAGRPQDGLAIEFTWVNGLPLIPGAAAHMTTRLVAEHLAGDHTLLLGKVDHLEAFDHEPLLFHSGRYARLAARSAEAPIGPYSLIAVRQFPGDDELVL